MKTTVMIDGKFSVEEWADAVELPAGDSLLLYVKHDKENIYLCLRGVFSKPALGGMDFYLTSGDKTLNLHASAQLGERPLVNGDYGVYTWWNNNQWVANIARIDKIAERKFHMDECKEFQLSRKRFKDKSFRLSYAISSPKGHAEPFPTGSSTTDSSMWLNVVIN